MSDEQKPGPSALTCALIGIGSAAAVFGGLYWFAERDQKKFGALQARSFTSLPTQVFADLDESSDVLKITTPEEARRLAKAIATDLKIYEHGAVRDARAGDSSYLEPALADAWMLYRGRVSLEADPKGDFFAEAIDGLIRA